MKRYPNIYFLGIGGIGMSALARYFLHEGCRVAGYDRTESHLTDELAREGAVITYEDGVENIPAAFRDPSVTMAVFTPAVPHDHPQMRFFAEGGFLLEKRSQMLGHLSEGKYVMAVAGTHGKTTTSTLIAWINRVATGGGSAFLGGISKNFAGNLVLGAGDRLAVEADEFDRSFLRGTFEAVREAFGQFAGLVRPNGHIILKRGVDIDLPAEGVSVWRYSCDGPCDFHAANMRPAGGGYYDYDIMTPSGAVGGCRTGVPGWVNVENSVAAVAAVWCAAQARGEAFDHDAVRRALASFEGVKRRFEFYVNTPRQVYMDDYAHHPEELEAAIRSVRGMFPARKLTAVFQPHLYTRTRDLCDGFAAALSLADEAVLLPIYPAREEPIAGVTSQIIADRVAVPCYMVEREALPAWLSKAETDVVVTFGAGNIDACCEAVAEVLRRKG